MSRKAKGRPPKPKHPSIMMTRGTRLRLQQLAKGMGMYQYRVLDLAIQRLYDSEADDVSG